MEPHHALPVIHKYCLSKGRKKLSLLSLVSALFLITTSLLFPHRLFCLLIHYSAEEVYQEIHVRQHNGETLCSPTLNNTICCDRTAFRTDVCFMRGDVRTHSRSKSILLDSTLASPSEQKIRPYTRKWEGLIMSKIPELRLRATSLRHDHPCHVIHNLPAVVFSTGGYTGNVFHEFNDGIIPLYITARHFNKQVVFVILDYRRWWFTKYADVLSRLSNYSPINFANDTRTHCFPEATVGLCIHGDLTVNANREEDGVSIQDFQQLLDDAYRPPIRSIEQDEQDQTSPQQMMTTDPKLVIMSRNGSRAIENEAELVKVAEGLGYSVVVVRPDRTTELAKIYRELNSSAVMVGVHGAAMTHFLFMRPGSVFIQIVPLGTEWAAETYYGEAAKKLGLLYMAYKILPEESSLYQEYDKDDPVLKDPKSVNAKGWQVTKKVFLDGQNVRLDLERFRRLLAEARAYFMSTRDQRCTRFEGYAV